MSNVAPEDSDHAILTFLSVQKRLKKLGRGSSMDAKMSTPLAKALTNLSSPPWVSSHLPNDHSYFPLHALKMKIGGEDAGTLLDPDVAVILRNSIQSSFGKGDQTVVDTDYRSGREISAKDISFEDPKTYEKLEDAIIKAASTSLFIKKSIECKFYKLAVYEQGGHFDWHRDSTHGDNHHGTVLVVLNTSWSGEGLLLRHNGAEVSFGSKLANADASDQEILEKTGKLAEQNDRDVSEDEDGSTEDSSEPSLPTKVELIAFYTDVEHKVAPVKDGVRIVLQFDLLIGSSRDDDHNDSDDSELDDDEDREPILEHPFVETSHVHADQASLASFSTLARKTLASSGSDELGIGLRHLYRKASIRPEYLKGVDLLLFNELSQTFDVVLSPVILTEDTDYEGIWEKDIVAYKFESTADSSDSSDEENYWKRPSKKAKFAKTVIHIPWASDLVMLTRQDYIEHTGNEAQAGSVRYFGGAMFIKAKESK